MPNIDPSRQDIQPPIPTHPADPAEAGDADKVVGGPSLSDRQPGEPASRPSQIPTGPDYDHVGGPGLGVAPEDGDDGEMATTKRARDSKAEDLQDRRDH